MHLDAKRKQSSAISGLAVNSCKEIRDNSLLTEALGRDQKGR